MSDGKDRTMRTKEQWILNYLKYHKDVKMKDIIRSCGESARAATVRDVRKLAKDKVVVRGPEYSVGITKAGLELRDDIREDLWRNKE